MSARRRQPPRRLREPARPIAGKRADLDERIADMLEAQAADRAELERERREMLHAPDLDEDERDYRHWLESQSYDDGWDPFDDWSDDYEEPDPLPRVVRSWLDGSLSAPDW